jgi:3-hydroxybutyryl-CoA dehydrogenase
MAINKVLIVGEGELAEKIQGLLSKAGVTVVASDPNSDYSPQLADVDMVLEAAPEDVESKARIFRHCDGKAPQKAIFATTTSCLGVNELSAVTKRLDKFIGLHFNFNPLEEKCLVEVVKGLMTSEETLQAAKELVEKAGAVAVEASDAPGFIVDKVLASVVNEAAYMYMIGIAGIEDIDKMMKVCANWPMGPFEYADAVGLDHIVATLELLSQKKGPQYLPCLLLKDKVAIGQLGKKTGMGFYSYR